MRKCAALILLVPLSLAPPDIAAFVPDISPWAEKFLTMHVGSDLVFWLAAKFARNIVIHRVLGTPPQIVAAAMKDEQERIRRIMHTIQPIGSRIRGIRNDARISRSLTRFALDRISADACAECAR